MRQVDIQTYDDKLLWRIYTSLAQKKLIKHSTRMINMLLFEICVHINKANYTEPPPPPQITKNIG